MPTPSWLDGLDLDPVTDRHITQGAAWLGLSREQFAEACLQRHVDAIVCTDPDFIATAVRRYVDETIAQTPNAAEIFEMR